MGDTREEMTDSELCDFICVMKRKARRAHKGRAKRIAYTEKDRQNTIKVLEMVEARGGTLMDVCEMLSVNRHTMMGWLEKFTSPDSDWHLSDVASRLLYKLAGDPQ